MQIERYMGRLSGPLLDRIDIHIEVPPVPFRELKDDTQGTSSAAMREEVLAARAIQAERFSDAPNSVNGTMRPPQIRKHCKLATDAEELLRMAMDEMGLSARAHDKILRISRTIADLDKSEQIAAHHLLSLIHI